MNKIGLVTFYKSYNYGAWLQAYATEKFLQMNNYDVEIIEYCNKFESDKLKYSYKEKGKYIGYITSLLKSILFGKVRYYRKGFKKYLNVYYYLSQKKYSDIKQLKNVKYDILIVGSDQVWNPEITNGLDDVFLLNFGQAKKRISIASSMGSKALSEEDRNVLVQRLNRFDAISVREQFAKDYLQNDVSKDIKVVLDPTFLLESKVWKSTIAKDSKYFNVKDKYILTYFVSKEKNSEACIALIDEYSKAFGLPVWSIQFSSFFSKGVDKKILGASIADFIALIMNAELIITDSFHGTALSINMNKNFVSYKNSENPIRTYNLLEKLGLLKRINMRCSEFESIDYSEANSRLEVVRKDTQDWILMELNK